MDTNLIKERFEILLPFLDERLQRIYAAAEAKALGYGGISIVHHETGISRRAITVGCEELNLPEKIDKKRIRREGGGRKRTVDKDPLLKQDLESLIEPTTRGDPEKRIIEIIKYFNADTYISGKGSGSQRYVFEEEFEKNDIKVIFDEFIHPIYKQTHPGFVPNMSVLDLLFNIGDKAKEMI